MSSPGIVGTPLRARPRWVSSRTSASSSSYCAIGNTVSKLNRRLSAALISLTPRSRVFAVATTLKPTFANKLLSCSSSGIEITRSYSAASSESWISRGQRVISSNRTILPRRIPS